MAQETQFTSDKTGGLEKMRGSDGRANVSSRQDSRGYYNSRDESEAFSLTWDDASSAAGDFIVYWKNTSTDKDLVISSVGLNADTNVLYEMNFVSGTAAGTTATPTNLNAKSDNDAPATAFNTAVVTGLTKVAEIDHAYVLAGGHEELRLGDRVRLGQNDAIAIKIEVSFGGVGSAIHSSGVIFGFYE